MYKKIKYPNIETCIINKNSAFPMNKKNLVKWLNLELHDDLTRKMFHTGKSFSEVLTLASTTVNSRVLTRPVLKHVSFFKHTQNDNLLI